MLNFHHRLVWLASKSVSFFLSQLEQMCQGVKPNLAEFATTDSQKQNIQAILDLLELSGQLESDQAPVFTALNLTVSALVGKKAVLCANFITEVKYCLRFSIRGTKIVSQKEKHAECPENLISLSLVFI